MPYGVLSFHAKLLPTAPLLGGLIDFVPLLAGGGFVGPFVMSIIFYHRSIREGYLVDFLALWEAFYEVRHVQVRERTTN